MPAIPPINTTLNNPMQGNTQINKIDFHNLGTLVRKLRDAGGTHISIAEEINNTVLKDNNIKISSSGVWRWMKENIDDDKDYRSNDNQAINLYYETCKMLESVTKQIEIVESGIDVITKTMKKNEDVLTCTRHLKELQMSYEKLISNKQRMLNTIGELQERIYNYNNYTTIINTIFDFVEDKCGLTVKADIHK